MRPGDLGRRDHVGAGRDRFEALQVGGLQQRLPRREVPVQRADPHPRTPGDVVQGGALTVLGERLRRDRQQPLAITPRIRPHGPDLRHPGPFCTQGSVAAPYRARALPFETGRA
jgi:hypothetical protein